MTKPYIKRSVEAAFVALGLDARQLAAAEEWRRQVEAPASTKFARIRSILDGQGLTFVTATDLTGLAPGFVTGMDGVPATLFEALFTELA